MSLEEKLIMEYKEGGDEREEKIIQIIMRKYGWTEEQARKFIAAEDSSSKSEGSSLHVLDL